MDWDSLKNALKKSWRDSWKTFKGNVKAFFYDNPDDDPDTRLRRMAHRSVTLLCMIILGIPFLLLLALAFLVILPSCE